MDVRHIRPLSLPPCPRRNRYIPMKLPLMREAGVKNLRKVQTFSGSGYSTPKVSTVTFFITCGVRGLSL